MDPVNEEGNIGGGLLVTRRTSLDLDRLTKREKAVASSRISMDLLWVGDGILTSVVFGYKGDNSPELTELVDSRCPRYVNGRSALTKNWPTRVRDLYISTSSSGLGSGWTVDFHNIRSHLFKTLISSFNVSMQTHQLGTRFLLDES